MERGICKFYTSLSLVLAAAAVGCGSSDENQAPPVKELEIYSWMTSGSERDALDRLLSEVIKIDPELMITNATQEGNVLAGVPLPERVAHGSPPDSWQQLPGLPLIPLIDANQIAPIDSIAAAQNWEAVFPNPVLDSGRRNGHLYVAPLNIERGNTLFYNKALFADKGIEAPTGTIEDFFAKADALKAAGVTAPLAVSDKGGWTVGAALFDSILLAQAGATWTYSYLTGGEVADAPQMRAALDTTLRMMSYANGDRTQLGWSDAVGLVCDKSSTATPASNTAAMLLLPDFVKGEFAHRNCGVDVVDYVPINMAGEAAFTFVGMSWPLAAIAPHQDPAIEFLTLVGSVAGQAAFNPTKGSIPARKDIDVTNAEYGFDTISRHTALDFQDPASTLILGWAASTPSEFQVAINDALQKFADPSNAAFGNVQAVMDVMVTYYSRLRPL
jgi:glucose/mannose transport system substrate-binding protein